MVDTNTVVTGVHRNLTELEALHLVADGNARRPEGWYDVIDIDLPLGVPAVDGDEATA